jgi:hypothetical protein
MLMRHASCIDFCRLGQRTVPLKWDQHHGVREGPIGTKPRSFDFQKVYNRPSKKSHFRRLKNRRWPVRLVPIERESFSLSLGTSRNTMAWLYNE